MDYLSIVYLKAFKHLEVLKATTRVGLQVTVTLADAKNRDPALVLQVLKEMTKGQAAREMSLVDLAKVVWSIGPTAQVSWYH